MTGENVLNRSEQPSDAKLEDNKYIFGGTIETEGGKNMKLVHLSIPIGDISSAGSVFLNPGFAGRIVSYSSVIDAAITAADAILTLEILTVEVADSDLTIATAGSAAGDVDRATPSALNIFAADVPIEIVKDGGSTTTSNGVVTLDLLPD